MTVVEYLDAITPGMDAEVAKAFQRTLTKQGFTFILGAAVQGATRTATGARVDYKLKKDDSAASLEADAVLVATGRRPNTAGGLGLEALGVEMLPARQSRPMTISPPTSPASTPSAMPSSPDAGPQGRG